MTTNTSCYRVHIFQFPGYIVLTHSVPEFVCACVGLSVVGGEVFGQTPITGMQLGREGWVSVGETRKLQSLTVSFLVGVEGGSCETLANSDNPEGIWLMGGGKLRELRLNLG